MTRILLLCLFLSSALSISLAADDAKPSGNAPKITYDEHIKPVFRDHCLSCHNQEQKKGGLALDTYSGTMTGGSSGEVVLGGDVESSRLFALTSHKEQPKMPPMQDRLATAKLDLLQKWIEGGALENSGSKATIRKKNSAALMSPTGQGKPDQVAMPERLWREPVKVTARPGAVFALATSPWGPLAAVAGQRQVVLYNTESGECVGILPFTEGIPQVLRFSRNGAVLLAAGGRGGHSGFVVLFDVKTGKRIAKLGDELDAITAADINSSHTLVALGSPLKKVRIYSVESGEKLFEMKKHTDWINAVEFSPDGVLLASADRSGGLFIWEAATAREFLDLRGHKGSVFDVAWRPDSNLLASCGEDGTVKLWELNEGNAIKTWNAHSGGVFSLDYTHDGRLVSSGRDKTVRTWSGDGNALKSFTLPDDALRSAWSHDGKLVLGGDFSGNLKLWDHETAAERAILAVNPPSLAQRLDAAHAQQKAADTSLQMVSTEFAVIQKQLDERTAQVAALETKFAAAQADLTKFASQRDAAAKQQDELKADAAARQQALDAKQASLTQETAGRASADADLDAKQKSAVAAAASLAELKAKADKLAADQSPDAPAAAEAVKVAQSAMEKANLDRDAAAAIQKQKADQIARLTAEIGQAQQMLDAVRKSLADISRQRDDSTAKTAEIEKSLPAIKTELENRRKEKDETVAAHGARKQALDAAQASAAAAGTRVTSLTQEIASFAKAREQFASSIVSARGQLDQVQSRFAQADGERAVAEKAIAEKIAAAKVLADRLAALNAEYQLALKAQQETEAQGAAKLKQAGELKTALEAAKAALEQIENEQRLFAEAYPQAK